MIPESREKQGHLKGEGQVSNRWPTQTVDFRARIEIYGPVARSCRAISVRAEGT